METREDSKKAEKEDDAVIKIFTDGSGYEGNAGAAAVMYRRGRDHPEKILQYHLGPLEQHTNYEAEAVGLLLAMWMLQRQHVVGHLNVSIYTDSQGLVKAVNTREPHPGQHIIEELLRLAANANTIVH